MSSSATTNTVMIKRVLISVSDKTYIEEFARSLLNFGVEIVATGGTAERLKKAQIKYRPIETFTGNPEAFDGRMKTLSFKLESAILYDRSNSKHVEQAEALGIESIDCVVCNFYPFEDAVAKGASEEELVNKVDIGGPTMVRAAAKNFKHVLTLTDPNDYTVAIQEMHQYGGGVSPEFRKLMMQKAFEKVYQYDESIYEAFQRKHLRYGENPHQLGFFVPDVRSNPEDAATIDWNLVDGQGLELSYNNILDAQAAYGAMCDALEVVRGSSTGVCAIVKHNNPCGLASSATIAEAFELAWQGDPVSSFGGVVALSAPLTIECARMLDQKFVEVILAPGFEEDAIAELRRKKKKLRILKILRVENQKQNKHYLRTRVHGGMLVQQPDEGVHEELKSVTKKEFPHALKTAARFAVVAVKWLKSNATSVVYSHANGSLQLVGMGSGQPNRVDAVSKLTLPKMKQVLDTIKDKRSIKERLANCVLASDAFFPFPDSVEEASKGGVLNIIQPGGSVKDPDVIAACYKLNITMLFSGRRHFRH